MSNTRIEVSVKSQWHTFLRSFESVRWHCANRCTSNSVIIITQQHTRAHEQHCAAQHLVLFPANNAGSHISLCTQKNHRETETNVGVHVRDASV